MSTYSENTSRIAKNTIMLYCRMLFSMFVSLYTSRVILNTLGVEDYGIHNVVGGFVGMFSLISSSLSASTSRFLTFELGKGDIQRLKTVFSTSLVIHSVLAIIVIIMAETIGIWFLNNRMTIPLDRMYAANWVFQASILSFILGLFSVPYNASIIAHERMNVFAYVGIIDVLFRLFIVLFIAHSPWVFDKLIVYSSLLVVFSMTMQCIYLWYCRKYFEECKLHLNFNLECWKEMSSFAGWNFIGCTAGLLKDQGVNIIQNIFGGPVLNAARGIATSVNTAVVGFVGNFMTALNPQITKSYANGDINYMFSLVEKGSRFSFYVMLVLSLPLLFETEFVLTLWLKQYPEHTANFVRLVLLLTMSDIVSNTLIVMQNATGKIRNYQIVVGGTLMMNFPLSYICLSMNFPPESVYIVGLFISVICMFLRLWFLRTMVGFSMKHFLKHVYVNICIVSAVAAVLPTIFFHFYSSGLERFFILSFLCVSCSILSIYWVGCSKEERRYIYTSIIKIRQRLLK